MTDDNDKVPFVAISNEELEQAPRIKAGDRIACPTCPEQHVIESALPQVRNANGEWVLGRTEFLFYCCGEKSYMAGLDGKSVLPSPRS